MKNVRQTGGEIGDDYIAFDDIEELKESTDREADKPEEQPSKEKPLESKHSKEPKESKPAPKPKLNQKIFHPKAQWLTSKPSDYGYLSGPRSSWLHFSERLHRELLDLSDYLAPTPAESTARALLIKKCDAVVRKLFPGMRIECFGSVETGLYLPTSDVDLVVIPVDSSINEPDPLIAPPLRRLARALIKAGVAEGRSVQVISRARVPIIKFTDKLTGLPCDISFNVASGLDGARFLKQKLAQYPGMKPLLRFLKLFLHLRGLNEVFRGGLGSFSTACLLLSFLQIHPLLQLGYVEAHENLGVLLMEFLQLYGRQMNFERVGITVGLDEKNSQEKKQFFGYYDKADLDFYNESRPGLLSIQDPQSPSNDLARPSFGIASVRQAFEHAFNHLSAAALELDTLAHDKEAQQWQRQRTDGSILAGLIRLPEDFLQQRAYIERIFQKHK